MRTKKTTLLLSAAALLVLMGTLNRWVTASRASASVVHQTLSIPLADIPLKLGPYIGQDVPLEPEIVKTAGVDSFIQRSYIDPINGRHMLLYVGYWGQENIGMGHGPEVCYPAVGWQPEGTPRTRNVEFDRPTGHVSGRMSIHRFTRVEVGGISRRLVAFLAVADGQYRPKSTDIFWHRPTTQAGRGHFLAHVQIAVSLEDDNWNEEEANIVEFVEMLSPHLAQCWPYETVTPNAHSAS